jgi:hypothetical protein
MAGQPERYFLRLLNHSPFERRPAGWRFGTRRIADAVVARLIASGAARVDGAHLHPVERPS